MIITDTMQYQKHKYNIFPEMAPDEYERLKEDMKENGFNDKFPIVLYQDGVLDGWHRYRASEELSVPPRIEFFKGSDSEAVGLVMQTNKRRNLTSSQWAAIAVEADEIIEALRLEAKERQVRKPSGSVPPSMAEQKNAHESREKLAEQFNTSKTYISEAQLLKRENPEELERVKRGEKSLATTSRERQKKRVSPVEVGIVEDRRETGQLSKSQKDKFFGRANSIIKEVNAMPIAYRKQIKHSIKT